MKYIYALFLACTVPTGAWAETNIQGDNEATSTPLSVTVENPTVRDIDYTLTALGSVVSINRPTLSAETSGRITRIHADVGSSVEAGDALAEIDNTLHQIKVAETRAELKRHEVLLKNQQSEVERHNRLAKSQSVSRDQLEDKEDQLSMLISQRDVAQKQYEQALFLESKTHFPAPTDGAISQRHVSIGDYVTPGQALFDLVFVERLRARLSFPEQDASNIQIGQEVHLRSPAAPTTTAIGEVTLINPRINPLNRAIEVLVEFDNPGGWYPGSSVDATLVLEHRTGALTIPPLSVVNRDGREIVFVAGNNRALARPVTVGWRETDWIELTEGVKASDLIVVEGAALLTDGSYISHINSTQ